MSHNARAGQVALGFFRQNEEEVAVILFSREQGAAILDQFASCFKPGEKDEVWVQLDDPEYLPANSSREPIIIGGTAGSTLCRHYVHYQKFASADNQEHGYESMGARIIAYSYTADFYVGQQEWPKSTIIALRDGSGMYHVYIVFSDQEAERVLMLHLEAKPDMPHYREIMKRSSLPPSDLPTIHIGGECAVVAARAICIYIEVPGWLGHRLDRVEKPSISA